MTNPKIGVFVCMTILLIFFEFSIFVLTHFPIINATRSPVNCCIPDSVASQTTLLVYTQLGDKNRLIRLAEATSTIEKSDHNN
jgi:hypothetical protein